MKNEEIIKSVIGNKLESGRIQSFFLKGELVSRVSVTFLKFDKWIRVVVTDGSTIIGLENDAFEKIEFYGDEEYRYPINKITNDFPEFEKYYGKKLLAYKEIVHIKDRQDSYGINFYFDNDLNFIIYDHPYPIDENEFFFENTLPIELIEKNNNPPTMVNKAW